MRLGSKSTRPCPQPFFTRLPIVPDVKSIRVPPGPLLSSCLALGISLAYVVLMDMNTVLGGAYSLGLYGIGDLPQRDCFYQPLVDYPARQRPRISEMEQLLCKSCPLRKCRLSISGSIHC